MYTKSTIVRVAAVSDKCSCGSGMGTVIVAA